MIILRCMVFSSSPGPVRTAKSRTAAAGSPALLDHVGNLLALSFIERFGDLFYGLHDGDTELGKQPIVAGERFFER